MERILGFACVFFAVATFSAGCFFSFEAGCGDDTECSPGTTCDPNGACQPDTDVKAETTAAAQATTAGTAADAWDMAETPTATSTGHQTCNTWWDCPYNQVCSGTRSLSFCVAPENCALAHEEADDNTCSGSLRCAASTASVECSYDGNISTCACFRDDGSLFEFVAGGAICDDPVRMFDQVNAHCHTRVFPNAAQ